MSKRTDELDGVKDSIIDIISKAAMTNEEAASMLTVIMQNFLVQKHNAVTLEALGVTEKNLSIDLVCEIQKIWTKEYFKENIKLK